MTTALEVRVQKGSVTELPTPLLVVNLFQGVSQPGGAAGAVDRALGGLISQLIADGEITGERDQVRVVHVPASSELRARRVAVAGLGRQAVFDLEAVRHAAALAARTARELRVEAFASIVHGAGIGGLDPVEACRATAESSLLALYRYERFKEATKPHHDIRELVLVEQDSGRAAEFEEAVRLAARTCESVCYVRDLSVGPSNLVTPLYLAEQAKEIARRHGLEVMVWGREELRSNGMNAILAVNAGSAEPPAFVVLRYRSEVARKTLAVVGKGITFDSGGISIKPADHMEYMRHDMSGAAAVLGFMDLAAATQLPVNVVGVFAATENLPSGSAYKPGDIYRAYNGKTMEIVDTDAEGRVILSDALAYTAAQRPDAIIDLATLTGACTVALGNHATGLFTNNQALADLVVEAGERTGERCWQLPLWEVYQKQIETPMADVRNTGGRRAGAITAAHFLREFVGDTPWVHLDIAGTAYSDREQKYVAPYNPKLGATGVGVRLLWQFCQFWGTT